MGANAFKKRLEKQSLDVEVDNYAIEKVPKTVDVIVTHKSLEKRSRMAWPDKRIVTIENFMKDEQIEGLLEEIQNQNNKEHK